MVEDKKREEEQQLMAGDPAELCILCHNAPAVQLEDDICDFLCAICLARVRASDAMHYAMWDEKAEASDCSAPRSDSYESKHDSVSEAKCMCCGKRSVSASVVVVDGPGFSDGSGLCNKCACGDWTSDSPASRCDHEENDRWSSDDDCFDQNGWLDLSKLKKKEDKCREKQQEALQVLKANPLRRQPWMTPLEKCNWCCLMDETFHLRLELMGIDDGLSQEYDRHEALKFRIGHICPAGVVANLQLGYWGFGHGIEDNWEDADWSEAPTDFLNQFEKKTTSLRVVSYCQSGGSHVICERDASRNESGTKVLEAINSMSPLLQVHNCGERPMMSCCEVIFHIELQLPAVAFAELAGIDRSSSHIPFQFPMPRELSCDRSSPVFLVGGFWSSQTDGFSFPFDGTLQLLPALCDSTTIKAEVPVIKRARYALETVASPEPASVASKASQMLDTFALLLKSRSVLRAGYAGDDGVRQIRAWAFQQLADVLHLSGMPQINGLQDMQPEDALEAVANMAPMEGVRLEATTCDIDEDTWKWLENCLEVDRVSIWALDSFGRTCFQLHGLEMPNPVQRRMEDLPPGQEDWRRASAMNGNLLLSFGTRCLALTFLDPSCVEHLFGDGFVAD